MGVHLDLVISLLLFWIYIQNKSKNKTILLWSAGFVLYSITLLLTIIREHVPNFFSITFSNTIQVIATVLFIKGTCILLNKKFFALPYIIIVTILFCIYLYWCNNFLVRVTALCLVQAILFFILSWYFIKNKSSNPTLKFSGFSALIISIVSILRLFSTLYYSSPQTNFLTAGIDQSVFVFITVPFISLLGFGFVGNIYGQLIDERDKLLQDKDLLMKEIHHRVKNNLFMVTGLLNIKNLKIDNEQCLKPLNDIRNRINIVTKLYESFQTSTDYQSVNIKNYINNITHLIKSGFQDSKKVINIILDVPDARLDATMIIPVGLIINELLTNAYKHAFKTQSSGTINISFKENFNHYELIVKNDGTPLSDNFSLDNPDSTGLQLIVGLTQQLNATIIAQSDEWTAFVITIPKI